MIKIEHSMPGYTVQFSAPGTGLRAYRVHAKDIDEVKLAVGHHLGDGGRHVNGLTDSCPLCRLMQEEAKIGLRKMKRRTEGKDANDDQSAQIATYARKGTEDQTDPRD